MFSFVIKRLLQAILVMLIVTLIAFLLFQFVGDPVTQMLGQEATEADRLALTHELGLDQPIWKQFGAFIANTLHGDFGMSLRQGAPVVDLFKEKMPATLELAFFSAMIIPVKMKWLSVLYLVFIGYYFMNANLMGRVNIVMSLLNFVIFYFSTKDFRRLSPKQIKRRRNYAKQVRVNNSENVTHKCYVCGITDKEAPDMQFRYCSRCTGNKEYCQDHLFTHEHK